MKIRLTESQYKRLLSEDSDDRTYGIYLSHIQKEVGEKITKFIAKLFININEVDKITASDDGRVRDHMDIEH